MENNILNTKEEFIYQKYKDEMKNLYCDKLSIPLLLISYKETTNAKRVILEK
jgi:hypothetical protein